MSDTQLINEMRNSKRRAHLWDRLTNDQKREFILSLDGDTWHLDELLEDFVEARQQ